MRWKSSNACNVSSGICLALTSARSISFALPCTTPSPIIFCYPTWPRSPASIRKLNWSCSLPLPSGTWRRARRMWLFVARQNHRITWWEKNGGISSWPLYICCLRNRELSRHDVVLWCDDPPLPEWVPRHFPDARVALRVDDVATMQMAVQQGIGVARLPAGGYSSGLLRLNPGVAQSDWGLWVLIHGDLRATGRGVSRLY